MKPRTLFLLTFLFLGFLSNGHSREYRKKYPIPLEGYIIKFSDQYGTYKYQNEIIHYQSEDKAPIEATLLLPETKERKPGLVFVHMWARDRNTYWGLPEFLASHGYPSIYMDLRGHGKSNFPKSNHKITPDDKNKKYSDFFLDVLPGIEILNSKEQVLKNNLILIGASLGCPLGIKAAAVHKEKFIGMIHMAPAISYFDANSRDALEELKNLPTFVIAEEKDRSFSRATRFFSFLDGYKVFFPTDKIGHGTDALFYDIGFPTIILNWVRQIEDLNPFLAHLKKQEFLFPPGDFK